MAKSRKEKTRKRDSLNLATELRVQRRKRDKRVCFNFSPSLNLLFPFNLLAKKYRAKSLKEKSEKGVLNNQALLSFSFSLSIP